MSFRSTRFSFTIQNKNGKNNRKCDRHIGRIAAVYLWILFWYLFQLMELNEQLLAHNSSLLCWFRNSIRIHSASDKAKQIKKVFLSWDILLLRIVQNGFIVNRKLIGEWFIFASQSKLGCGYYTFTFGVCCRLFVLILYHLYLVFVSFRNQNYIFQMKENKFHFVKM